MLWFWLFLCACLGLGCERREVEERARPVATSAAPKPDACRPSNARQRDEAVPDWLPERVGELCVDPHADVRRFGRGEKEPLAAGCTQLGGDCSRFTRFGLTRFVIVPYVVSSEPRARVSVTLLELESPEAAFAAFTQRVLTDAAEGGRVWQPVGSSRTSVVSGTSGLLVHAERFVLLEFSDETKPPARAAERARPLLEALGRELARTLPGKAGLPAAAAALDARDGGPKDLRFEHEDLFGISGLGSGAVARYDTRAGPRLVAVLVRPDEDSAKDVMRTLRRIAGARPLKGTAYETIRVSLREGEGARRFEWFFGRKRGVVVGVGRAPEKLDRHREALARHAEVARLNSWLGGT